MLYLPRLRSRADHSLAKLRDVGFANVALDAGIDGDRGDAHVLADLLGWRFESRRTAGEVAFCLSTVRLWARVVDEGLPYLLIFEDDVLPRPDVAQIGPLYWDETPADVDFLFMGNQIEPALIANDQRRVVAYPSWCLHAYVITRAGARQGLELLREKLARDDHGLAIIDAELKRWMADERVRYACWNGTMLPKLLPHADDVNGSGTSPDVVWPLRDTGVFFQNFALGSALFPNGRPG